MSVKEKHKSHTMTINTITSNEEHNLADIEILHRRLGHVLAKVLKQISTLKFQPGCYHIQPCNVFPLQGKLDFPFQIVQTNVVDLFTPNMVMFRDHIECLVMMVVDFFSY